MSVKKTALEGLELLKKSKGEGAFDPAVFDEMARLTELTGREVIVSVDPAGKILGASFGTSDRAHAELPKDLIRHTGVRNFLILHTHPNNVPSLSEADLSTAAEQCPAAILAVAVKDGKPGRIGVGLPVYDEQTGEIVYESMVFSSPQALSLPMIRENREAVNTAYRRDHIHEEEEREERAVLIGIDAPGGEVSLERSMEELRLLTETAGVETVGEIVQSRQKPDLATYLGSGKLDELILLVQNTGADVVIANDSLAPAQMKNLEEKTGAKVIDRTQLILDIFADHASSAEGRLQVELAQQRYRLSHIRGLGQVLSRTGGGIGTRGPGEKKLETDRRRIERQIYELERKFEKLEKSHETSSAERKKSSQKVVSLVGYTNAGKSTLFNRMTGADVTEKDALFVTLDSTVRKSLESRYLLSDTVGFIDKLPHELIRAFRTTLSEARDADVLLHVIDASDEQAEEHIRVVLKVLREIGCLQDQEIIPVYNKIDRLSPEERDRLEAQARREGGVLISAKNGEGLDRLANEIGRRLEGEMREITLLVPYEKGAILSKLHDLGEEEQVEYLPEGTRITLKIREDSLPREALELILDEGEANG